MELALRILAVIGTILAIVVNQLLSWLFPRQKPNYPPITDELLTKSVGDLIVELRQKKITSEQLVQVYINRIKEVDSCINAVVHDRFESALKDAQLADKMIAKANNEQLAMLFTRYPLLGIPFTVKESCGVKGLSHTVGNIQRKDVICQSDGEVVENLRSAGCIPLLVSANPEFCLSFETNTHTHGRCLNPYDYRRTAGGSSGGEGALNGSGASLFGLGSDIAGSIRLPSMFCGVFGHKPTGGLTSVKGHFPNSPTEPEFATYLQLGPITRFARDMPILLQVMAGKNAEKLKFSEIIPIKDIKIHYAYGFEGLNSWFHAPLDFEVKFCMKSAVKCFEKGGLKTKEAHIKGFRNSMEIGLMGLMNIKGIPSIMTQSVHTKPKRKTLIVEFFRALIGQSLFTKEAVLMELMQNVNAFISRKNTDMWRSETQKLKEEIIELLGTDGVLFFPSFHTTATYFHTSIINMVGVDMLSLFNMLGLPTTHVPMGLDRHGMPVGFQVIAAPYQDKLCLQIAAELEAAFGGWQPAQPHEI